MFWKKLISSAIGLYYASLASAAPAAIEERAVANRNPKVNGRLFQIDGVTQYWTGTNTWWLGHLFSDVDVERAMSQIASSGTKITRVWAFGNTNDPALQGSVYFQYLNATGGYYNRSHQNGLGRLDVVLQLAVKYNVKLILTLLNNYDDLGGINTYINAYGGTHQSFYTNTKAQQVYKDYIKFIVNRYKSSSAIFAWELCNEPRCSGCDTSVITNWASDVSAYIKSLDSSHLVCLGDEGWLTSGGDGSYAYSGYEGVDFTKNLAIPTLDFGTFHSYPNYWGYDYDWPNGWIRDHNAIAKAANKPVIFEEYGSPFPDNKVSLMKPWQDTVVQNTSVAVDMFWQFGTQIDSARPFDSYALYYDATPGSDYDVLAIQHASIMSAKPPVATL